MFGTQQRQELGKVFHDANAEAQRMGDRAIGTEHMTLALLADPESATAQGLGITLVQARETLQSLDFAALATVGIQAADPGPATPSRVRMRLTPAARNVFADMRSDRGAKPPKPQNVLLGLLERTSPDPAAALLDALGVDREAVRRRLAS